ncbi:MAG TPA: DUF4440 domain-containing protein, partial [Candidatus Binatia bacterium]|nr:DUF4440 domain-containing protein [Candidatus Binatia bacterium]
MRRAAKILIAGATFLVVAAPLPAQQSERVLRASLPASPNQLDATAARKAIEKANGEWMHAFRSGDSGAMARIYTSDASLFPPNDEQILEGPDDIVGYMEQQRGNGLNPPSLRTSDVTIMGNIAYEVGTYDFTFAGSNGNADS